MKILNFKVNGVRDYYQTFFSIIQPFSVMTPREAAILATVNEVRYLRESKTDDWKELVDSPLTDYITKEHGITKNNFTVITASLRKKGIINDNKIKKQYLLQFEKMGGILFSLKQIEDET